ncbi:MAG: hypothetical protein HZA23_06255 [Nitrospirae bacterium]|nr:hypothetical protein [Nitrospirota bacterium]
MKARGVRQEDLVPGVVRGKMLDLARWTLESDQVVAF